MFALFGGVVRWNDGWTMMEFYFQDLPCLESYIDCELYLEMWCVFCCEWTQ